MNPKQSLMLVFALLLVLLANSIFVVDQRAVAVVLEFDKFKSAVPAPGLHFKVPFAQTVEKFDRRLLTGTETESIPTGDQKTLNVEYYVKWRIADVATYYRATGGKDLVVSDRLMKVVKTSLRDVLGSRSLEQIISGNHDQMDEVLRREAQDKARDLGIEVADVRIENLSLPKEQADAYFDGIRADRKRQADDLRARGNEEAESIRAAADSEAQTTLAEAYRKAEALRGEGDGKAAEIYAKSYGQDPEFFAFYGSLNAYRESFTGKRNVLVLEPKGEFFKYFKDAGSGK
ncbi:MAG: protease modulator HflC [Nevskiales bacterium]